jgi:hypothetical protein
MEPGLGSGMDFLEQLLIAKNCRPGLRGVPLRSPSRSIILLCLAERVVLTPLNKAAMVRFVCSVRGAVDTEVGRDRSGLLAGIQLLEVELRREYHPLLVPGPGTNQKCGNRVGLENLEGYDRAVLQASVQVHQRPSSRAGCCPCICAENQPF